MKRCPLLCTALLSLTLCLAVGCGGDDGSAPNSRANKSSGDGGNRKQVAQKSGNVDNRKSATASGKTEKVAAKNKPAPKGTNGKTPTIPPNSKTSDVSTLVGVWVPMNKEKTIATVLAYLEALYRKSTDKRFRAKIPEELARHKQLLESFYKSGLDFKGSLTIRKDGTYSLIRDQEHLGKKIETGKLVASKTRPGGWQFVGNEKLLAKLHQKRVRSFRGALVEASGSWSLQRKTREVPKETATDVGNKPVDFATLAGKWVMMDKDATIATTIRYRQSDAEWFFKRGGARNKLRENQHLARIAAAQRKSIENLYRDGKAFNLRLTIHKDGRYTLIRERPRYGISEESGKLTRSRIRGGEFNFFADNFAWLKAGKRQGVLTGRQAAFSSLRAKFVFFDGALVEFALARWSLQRQDKN